MTDLFSEVIHTYSGIDIPAVSHPVEALYTRYLKGFMAFITVLFNQGFVSAKVSSRIAITFGVYKVQSLMQ